MAILHDSQVMFVHANDAGMTIRTENQPTDDQLMIAYARGDHKAFDTLYQRYRQPLFGYLYRHCRCEVLAGDLFQEVWLRVVASSKRFEQQGRFRSWVFTLAHNCLIDFYRKNGKQQQQTLEQDVEDNSNPEVSVDSGMVRSTLNRALDELPLEQRQAFYLREEQGFSVVQIANIQGISAEAAKSRLRYAYRKLRKALQEQRV